LSQQRLRHGAAANRLRGQLVQRRQQIDVKLVAGVELLDHGGGQSGKQVERIAIRGLKISADEL